MDATRISDVRLVMLKKLLKEEGPHELQINKLFSTELLSSDPRNHCVPLLDVIELRDDPPILVHPLLRCHYDPRFQTFGEFVTFFAQTCEVCPCDFSQSSVVLNCSSDRAYNSCMKITPLIGMPVLSCCILSFLIRSASVNARMMYENVMLEPSNMYPNSFHPVITRRSRDFRRKAKGYSRTWRPTKYLLIDFGHSRLYDPAKGPPLVRPIHGGDKSAPEHRNSKLL